MTGVSFPTDMVAKFGIKKGTPVTIDYDEAEKKFTVTIIGEAVEKAAVEKTAE